MAARSKGLVPRSLPRTALLAAVLLAFVNAVPGARSQGAGARRIVSLVPALTEALFAIGAGSQVVGVSSFDEFPPEVQTRPRVGALLDPDLERILTLRPDLVMVYGSHADLQSQLSRAGIRAFIYRHGGIQTTLDTIRQLGAATARESEAEALISSLQRGLDAARARVKGRARPRTLLVFERQPGTLREVYASGGVGFLHEMLEIAGGRNVFADVARESVQPSIETLLTSAPDVILEVRATALTAPRAAAEREAWASLSSVPAVRQQRVYLLSGDYLVVPGPRLVEATEAIARTLHPDAFK